MERRTPAPAGAEAEAAAVVCWQPRVQTGWRWSLSLLLAVPAFMILDVFTLKSCPSLSYPHTVGMTGVTTSVAPGEEPLRKCTECSSLELGPSACRFPVACWSSQALVSVPWPDLTPSPAGFSCSWRNFLKSSVFIKWHVTCTHSSGSCNVTCFHSSSFRSLSFLNVLVWTRGDPRRSCVGQCEKVQR